MPQRTKALHHPLPGKHRKHAAAFTVREFFTVENPEFSIQPFNREEVWTVHHFLGKTTSPNSHVAQLLFDMDDIPMQARFNEEVPVRGDRFHIEAADVAEKFPRKEHG